MRKEFVALNKLLAEDLKPMTKKELAFKDVLSARIKAKEITLDEAYKIMDKKIREGD